MKKIINQGENEENTSTTVEEDFNTILSYLLKASRYQ